MHNIYLFQPQYAVEYRNENNYWLPYSVGCIWSYAQQFDRIRDNYRVADIIFRREHPDDVLARINEPAVCAFSCYVWNKNYCLHLAERIKRRWPKTRIEFGGPETSGRMIRYDFIDSLIMGEGEENFLQILDDHLAGKDPEVFYEKRRLDQLDIPSPYLIGMFDDIMSRYPTAVWSMSFETNRGCPFACTFCDWGTVTYSKVKRFDIERVRADLEWIVGKNVDYLVCADANFGIFKDRDIEIARIIRDVANRSNLSTVNLQYAKNSSEVVFEIAQIIGDLSRGVTISMQSMNDLTLEAIERKNLEINDMSKLLSMGEERGVATYTEVILGLPLETKDSWRRGMTDILELGQHQSIDMWLTQLLENSELAQLASRQKYGIKSILAKDYMPLFNKNDYRDIEEDIDLVTATNTMSTEDLIESYMFGWMIIQFHISGYSQIWSRHLREVNGILYSQYYDHMWQLLQTHHFWAAHYQDIRDIISTYLHTGRISRMDRRGGHGMSSMSFEYLYRNRYQAYDFAKEVAAEFDFYDITVDQIQRCLLHDNSIKPTIWLLDRHPITWRPDPGKWQVITRPLAEGLDFYSLRRRGFLKNKFAKV